jgi:hypothetical protein
VVPRNKKAKSGKLLKVGDFQEFLFSVGVQKTVKRGDVRALNRDYFWRPENSLASDSNVLFYTVLRSDVLSRIP